MAGQTEKTISLEQLATLREKTEAISRFLLGQLTGHLETLRPLFAPRRLLGKYARTGMKEDVVGADKAFVRLQERFRAVCAKPFGLPPELDEDALEFLDNRLELYPWEYSYEAKTGKETKPVTITSPVRWVLSYSSGYSLSQVREVLAGKGERRSDHVRQFIVSALVMQGMLARFPGIGQLLADLRCEVHAETLPALGDLPLAGIHSCVPSFRPSDDLIVAATRFSGVPAFIELIDVEAVRALQDPLRAKIEQMLR